MITARMSLVVGIEDLRAQALHESLESHPTLHFIDHAQDGIDQLQLNISAAKIKRETANGTLTLRVKRASARKIERYKMI
jgi:hypothetical protein